MTRVKSLAVFVCVTSVFLTAPVPVGGTCNWDGTPHGATGCVCDVVCVTSGQIYYTYECNKNGCPIDCKYNYLQQLGPFLSTVTANCEDVGWWPPGPECNEQEDCEIASLTYSFDTYVPECYCNIVCV